MRTRPSGSSVEGGAGGGGGGGGPGWGGTGAGGVGAGAAIVCPVLSSVCHACDWNFRKMAVHSC